MSDTEGICERIGIHKGAMALGRAEALTEVLEHVEEEELGYEGGEPSTERPGRWTFTKGAAALAELREWLLAKRDAQEGDHGS